MGVDLSYGIVTPDDVAMAELLTSLPPDRLDYSELWCDA